MGKKKKGKGYKEAANKEKSLGPPNGSGKEASVSTGAWRPLSSPIDRERKPEELDQDRRPWVPFFTHSNYFVNQLAKVPLISETHRAIIGSKTNYTIGNGFILHSGENNPVFAFIRKMATRLGIKDPSFNKFNQWAKQVNPRGDNLLAILTNIAKDYFTGGNAYILLKRFKVEGQDHGTMFHLDFSKCRVKKANAMGIVESVYFAQDWSEDRIDQKGYKPLEYAKWPIWRPDPQGTGAECSIIHLSDYEPGYFYYGLPVAVASLLWQHLEHQIANYNLTEFKSGFSLHLLIQFISSMSQERAEVFIDEFFDTYSGESKNGGVFAQVVRDKSMAANVVNMRKDYQGSFKDLKETAAHSIAAAHQWPLELTSLSTGNKMGAGKELINVYLIANANVITPGRKLLLDQGINRGLEALGWENLFVTVSNSIPLTFFGDVDPEKVTLVNERRLAMGLEILDDQGLKKLIEEQRAARANKKSLNANTPTEE